MQCGGRKAIATIIAASTVFAALHTSGARADACDFFLSPPVLPTDEVKRCIDDMKFKQQLEERTRELQVNTLELEVCSLAELLSDLKPDASIVASEMCPKPKAPAKRKAPAK